MVSCRYRLRPAKALDSYLGWCLSEGFNTSADAPLFISLSNRNRGQRMGYKGVYNCIKDLADLAELDTQIHPHQLRHTFGTQLILEGMNPEFVRRLMRIKSIGGVWAVHQTSPGIKGERKFL